MDSLEKGASDERSNLFPRDRLDVANIGKKKELQASDVTFFSLKTPFCWPNNRYFERKSALLRLRNGLEAVAICNNISWKEIFYEFKLKLQVYEKNCTALHGCFGRSGMRRGPEHKGFRYSYGRGRQSDCRCHHPRRGNNHRHHLRGQRPFRDRRSRRRFAARVVPRL